MSLYRNRVRVEGEAVEGVQMAQRGVGEVDAYVAHLAVVQCQRERRQRKVTFRPYAVRATEPVPQPMDRGREASDVGAQLCVGKGRRFARERLERPDVGQVEVARRAWRQQRAAGRVGLG